MPAVDRRRAKAGVTTGEWGAALRDVFGEYRAPTGVGDGRAAGGGRPRRAARRSAARFGEARPAAENSSSASPGLDGHSNGAEQIAVRARDAGMDVVYDGIRLTPEEIVERRARRACIASACRSSRARIVD